MVRFYIRGRLSQCVCAISRMSLQAAFLDAGIYLQDIAPRCNHVIAKSRWEYEKSLEGGREGGTGGVQDILFPDTFYFIFP